MTDTILIDFSEPSSSIRWARFSDGIQKNNGVVESVADLTELAVNHTVIIWLSGELVTFTKVTIPKGQQRHLQRILPSLLEDNLATDIEQLHFAVGGISDSGMVNVAVIEQNILGDILQQFFQANIRPQAILPDSLAIPLLGEECSLSVNDGICQLRTSSQSAYVFDTQNLATLLPMMISNPAQNISLYIADKQRNTLSITQPYDWKDIAIDKLAQIPDKAVMAINLLQGGFSPQSGLQKHWLQWRSVAVLAMVALVVQLATVGMEIIQLNKQTKTYKIEIEKVFHSAFPDERRIVNAKAQMSQRLSKLQSQQGGAGFLMLLQQIAPALQQTKGISLTRISFERRLGEMRIDISAQNYSQLEQVKKAISKLGFNVELGSVAGKKGAYTSRLMIRGQQ